MSDDSAKRGAARFDVRSTSDSHFAWMRTRLALERTQMAWVRTGASLIGFGFTIYQVLEKLPTSRPTLHPYAARDLGLSLIASGVIAMFLAALDYRATVNYLWSPQFAPIVPDKRRVSSVLPITLIVFAVGIFAFIAVVYHFP
jgi:putative membrane protein